MMSSHVDSPDDSGDLRMNARHIRYSYTYGFMVRFAMRVYLATSGHGKVGFTMISSGNSTPPHSIGGVRGALERNIMRCYLAIDAYLGAARGSRLSAFRGEPRAVVHSHGALRRPAT